MIKNINKIGNGLDLDEDINKYIDKKIGALDKYLPRHARKTVHAEVRIKENATSDNKYECEVSLHVPDSLIVAKESTINMFAAVDIAEAKMKNQLRKYKQLHTQHRFVARRDSLQRMREMIFRRGVNEKHHL